MTFKDKQLQKHVEGVLAVVQDEYHSQRLICGLFDAYDFFLIREGEGSPRAKEALEHLVSEEMRPALRSWYLRFGNDINPYALQLRGKLGELAGEVFGPPG